jgi:UDP-3-O-[3-hydroxymyristoyl] glucosamine N-acyltransferase
VVGNPECWVSGVATLERAGPDDLAFLTNVKYRAVAETTRAGAVLVGPGAALAGRDLLEAPEPYLALAEILGMFEPPRVLRPGVSPAAHLGREVHLGAEVVVGPYAVLGDRVFLADRSVVEAGCVLGDGCAVGEGTTLRPRVVLYPGTRVGARCLIHSGVVLGSDGFGFATSGGKHRKVPQLGRVVVEDDVEIGANSTVDRGTLGDTIIGRGTKLDNLVMVAHGVEIGSDSLLVAQSGIAGSARLGARVTIAGQAGVAGHLTIGEGAVVAAKSAVFEDLPPDAFVAGIPAIEHRAWKKSSVAHRRLPEVLAELRSLRERVEALEKSARRSET